MRLLLDTHVWLWMIGPAHRLSDVVRPLLEDRQNDLFLSAAAVWEIGIKYEAGKLALVSPPSTLVPTHIKRSGVQPLAVGISHALRAAALPMHHRDPFDRLIVAQALEEELTLVTADPRLAAYGVQTIAANAV